MLYQIGVLNQAEMKSILADGPSLKFQSLAILLKRNQRKLALDVLYHPEYRQLSPGQFSQHLFSYDCSGKIASQPLVLKMPSFRYEVSFFRLGAPDFSALSPR